jgi:D-alanine-D-alanine ligase
MTKTRVAVLFNHVGEDEYEKLKEYDQSRLAFEPAYDIAVATVQEEYDAIVTGLGEAGYDALAWNVEDRLDRLHHLATEIRPDVVFNLVEHFQDDSTLETSIAGLLDLYRLPYTGSGPFALDLCRRKGTAKQLLLANDVPTPRYRQLWKPVVPKRHGLRYPMIIKPAREDASAGVEQESVVDDFQQLGERVRLAFEAFAPPILVEEFIDGRELHVAILGNDPPQVLPLLEYDFSQMPEGRRGIISYAVKWDPLQEDYHRVHSICPARVPKRVKARVEEVALHAYRVLNCRDYARLDIRLDSKLRPHVLEVNPNPDLTEGVSFMESAEVAGLSFPETLHRLVQMALARAH